MVAPATSFIVALLRARREILQKGAFALAGKSTSSDDGGNAFFSTTPSADSDDDDTVGSRRLDGGNAD